MDRNRWRRLLILLGKLLMSVLLTLMGLELGTRLLMPENRFELIPNTFDPVCRIKQLPNARGFVRCPEYAMEILTNDHGLREIRPTRHDRPAGQTRVLCLGDSFTCGLGVQAEETFAKATERLSGHEVLNAGVAATGTAEQLAWYVEEGRKFQPDLVVLALCVNDFGDNTRGGLFSFAADSSLVQHPAVETRTLHWLRKLRRLPGYGTWFAQSHFLNRFKQAFAHRHHGRLTEEAAGQAPPVQVLHHEMVLMQALLRELRLEVENDGSALLVMPIPALKGSGLPEQQLAELGTFLDHQGFAWLDLRPEFSNEEYYPVDGHWTATGHARAASILADALTALSQGN